MNEAAQKGENENIILSKTNRSRLMFNRNVNKNYRYVSFLFENLNNF